VINYILWHFYENNGAEHAPVHKIRQQEKKNHESWTLN